MQTDCYRFEKYEYNNIEEPIFENTVDATYIIHLENNGRLDNIKLQLSKFKPTDTTYICFNKGYKNCKKKEFITNAPYDLIDAFLTVFNHAEIMNYNNILILEDDFIFSEEIKKKEHIDNINYFLIINKHKIFHYYLGCLPIMLIPYDYYNYRNVSTACHSVIYSRKYIKHILSIDQKTITDWDLYNGIKLLKYKYCYYKPLCYQLIPETENSKEWGKNTIFKNYANIYNKLVMSIFKKLDMDKKPEPGFTYFYIFGKLVFISLLLGSCLTIKKIDKSNN